MKPNEIRIGNWVIYNGVKTEITTEDMLIICEGMRWDDLEPIPLTPEILEKAGFDKHNQIKTENILFELRYASKDELKNNCIGFPCFCVVEPSPHYSLQAIAWDIKHLHQLQNLYFALTGTELEINL